MSDRNHTCAGLSVRGAAYKAVAGEKHAYHRLMGGIEIPAKFKEKPIHFRSGGVINEAWVWVNGEYAGHKPYAMWWMGNHDFDLDVTKLVRPGENNSLVIRVWNKAETGGLYRRGFLWSPNETTKPTGLPEEPTNSN